jgi:hypothetical protein
MENIQMQILLKGNAYEGLLCMHCNSLETAAAVQFKPRNIC